jgi:hypothetical protein
LPASRLFSTSQLHEATPARLGSGPAGEVGLTVGAVVGCSGRGTSLPPDHRVAVDVPAACAHPRRARIHRHRSPHPLPERQERPSGESREDVAGPGAEARPLPRHRPRLRPGGASRPHVAGRLAAAGPLSLPGGARTSHSGAGDGAACLSRPPRLGASPWEWVSGFSRRGRSPGRPSRRVCAAPLSSRRHRCVRRRIRNAGRPPSPMAATNRRTADGSRRVWP